MCADNFERSEEYAKARGSFDDLGVEEQAVFIVESAVQMIVKSVQKAGDAFSKAVEEMKMESQANSGADDAEAPTKEKASGSAGAKKKSASGQAKGKAASKSKTKKA